MSNHWGYACLSHDPPILMDEFGGEGGRLNHGFDALVAALPIVQAGQWPHDLDGDPEPLSGSTGATSAAPVRFLLHHPHCRIAIFDEYGCAWTQSASGWQQVSGHDQRTWRTPIRNAEGIATGDWVNGVYPPEGMTACSCYVPTPAVSVASLVPWQDGWVLCTSCGGTHLATSTGATT